MRRKRDDSSLIFVPLERPCWHNERTVKPRQFSITLLSSQFASDIPTIFSNILQQQKASREPLISITPTPLLSYPAVLLTDENILKWLAKFLTCQYREKTAPLQILLHVILSSRMIYSVAQIMFVQRFKGQISELKNHTSNDLEIKSKVQ